MGQRYWKACDLPLDTRVSVLVKALPWSPCATEVGAARNTVTQRRKHTTTPLWPHFNHSNQTAFLRKWHYCSFMYQRRRGHQIAFINSDGFMGCPGLRCWCLLTFQSNRVIHFFYIYPGIFGSIFISPLLWRHQCFYSPTPRLGKASGPFYSIIREITDFDRFSFFPLSSVHTFYLKKSLNGLRTSAWNIKTPKKDAKRTRKAVFLI